MKYKRCCGSICPSRRGRHVRSHTPVNHRTLAVTNYFIVIPVNCFSNYLFTGLQCRIIQQPKLLLHVSFCSPFHAERLVPARDHRCLHRSPLVRGCEGAAPGAAHAPSLGGCHRPALSMTEIVADKDVSRSSGAAGN